MPGTPQALGTGTGPVLSRLVFAQDPNGLISLYPEEQPKGAPAWGFQSKNLH